MGALRLRISIPVLLAVSALTLSAAEQVAADLRVEVRDKRVVLAAMRLHCELRARHRREVFIAQLVRAADVVLCRR